MIINNDANNISIDEEISTYLAQYPLKPLKKPALYYHALDLMNKHVWTQIYPDIKNPDPFAFVTRENGDDGVYEIYVNPYVSEDVKACLLLHEFGHVIFTHIEMPVFQKQILINKIVSYWPELKQYFENSETYTQYSIEQIASTILNIAQDLEINGKLFTKEEWDAFQYNSQPSYIKALLESKKITNEDKLSILEWLKEDESKRIPFINGCHPDDFKYPSGLDYSQYVELFIKDHEIFFTHLKDIMQNISQQKNDETSFGKLTLEQIEKLRKQFNDANQGTTLENISEQEFNGNGGFSPIGRAKIKKSGNGKNYSNSVIDINDTKKLEKFILEQCYNKNIQNIHNNTMYNYNRKKYASNLLISKQTAEELYRPGNLYLLIDCSGSINSKSIDIMIKVVQKIAKNLGKNSRLIWWSTQLGGDYKLKDAQGPKETGGTDIAPGIKYIRKNYLRNSNDKLIIISDFFDTLPFWYRELSKMKNGCMGICWKTDDTKYSSSFEYLNTYYHGFDEKISVSDFVSVLPTILVNV